MHLPVSRRGAAPTCMVAFIVEEVRCAILKFMVKRNLINELGAWCRRLKIKVRMKIMEQMERFGRIHLKGRRHVRWEIALQRC